jgi:CBS domain-containing protein
MNLTGLDPSTTILRSLTVADAMHEGVITCSPSAELDEVAAAMAEHGIHCVVAIDAGPAGGDDDRLWGIVSDIDLMRGLGSPVRLDAGNLAALDVIMVAPEDRLDRVAQTMAEHEVAHLVVARDGRPIGVLSTLDIARVVARGKEQR